MAFTKIAAAGIGSTGTVTLENVVVTGSITASLTGTATSTTNIPNLTGAITSNNTTTSLGSFSSANLSAALTDETGSGAAVFATSPVLVTPSLGIATAQSLVVSGITTLGTVVVGGGTTQLIVTGNARITGILTIGTSSITLDGSNNQINVGTGVTVGSSGINVSGIITATQLSTGASGTGVNISTDTISGPATLTIDPAAVGDNTGAVRIKGDLYVDGTQFIVNSTTIELADFNVGIASTVGTNALLDGAGIGIGSIGIRKTLTWNNSSTALKSSEDFDISSGKVYRVNGTSVLSNNTLGSGVVTSSLTSVGTLSSLSVTGVTIDGSGNVGINDTSPSTRISGFIVRGTDTRYFTVNKANAQPTWRYDDNSVGSALLQNLGMTAANQGMGIQFQLGDSAANSVVGGAIYCLSEQTWTSTAATKDSYLRFDTTLDGVSTEAMRIESDGSVVIGDTTTSRRFKTRFESNTVYSSASMETTSAQVYIHNPDTTTGAYTGIHLAVANNSDAIIAGVRTGNDDIAITFGTRSTVSSGAVVERMRIDSAGRVTMPSQPIANIAKITGQTLTDTAGKITFTSETYDVGDNFSSSRYTAPVSGYYLVSTSLNISASANNVTISVYKNGAVYGGMSFVAYGANIRFDYSITGVVYLSASDYIEIFGVVNTGTLAVDNAGFLSVALLG